jgi:hypothetical protein
MIKIRFTYDSAYVDRLRTAGPRVIHALTTRINELMVQLSRYIIEEKLTSELHPFATQGTEFDRTGKLEESVHPLPTEIHGATITFGVGAAGGDAWYGQLYEAGHGSWTITADPNRGRRAMLKFMQDGKEQYRRWVTHPPIKATPFMDESREENMEDIREEMREAIIEAIRGGR